jgi:hypothetical protein
MAKILDFPSNKEGYELLMAFVDQSRSFAHGFDCERIWEKLSHGQSIECHTLSSQNRKQIELMAEHFKREAILDELADGWLSLTIP